MYICMYKECSKHFTDGIHKRDTGFLEENIHVIAFSYDGGGESLIICAFTSALFCCGVNMIAIWYGGGGSSLMGTFSVFWTSGTTFSSTTGTIGGSGCRVTGLFVVFDAFAFVYAEIALHSVIKPPRAKTSSKMEQTSNTSFPFFT